MTLKLNKMLMILGISFLTLNPLSFYFPKLADWIRVFEGLQLVQSWTYFSELNRTGLIVSLDFSQGTIKELKYPFQNESHFLRSHLNKFHISQASQKRGNKLGYLVTSIFCHLDPSLKKFSLTANYFALPQEDRFTQLTNERVSLLKKIKKNIEGKTFECIR